MHNYASPAPYKTTNISNINPQSSANSLQHVHPDSLVARHLPIGGFADPGQVDDVAGAVSASVQEEPELGIADHVRCLLGLTMMLTEGRLAATEGAGLYSTPRGWPLCG